MIPNTRAVSEGLSTFLGLLLEKDPQKRCFEKIIEDRWLNDGKKSLKEEIEKESVDIEVTEKEIENAYSISTIVMIVSAFFLFEQAPRKVGSPNGNP